MEKPAHLYSPINPPSGDERKDDHEEHTRKLLFELLRQRGIDIDSETERKLDGKSDIETLLRVIQNEKKKKENQHEIPSDNNATFLKSSKPHIQIQHKFFNEFWHLVFQLNELWLLSIASNPFARWCWTTTLYSMYAHK